MFTLCTISIGQEGAYHERRWRYSKVTVRFKQTRLVYATWPQPRLEYKIHKNWIGKQRESAYTNHVGEPKWKKVTDYTIKFYGLMNRTNHWEYLEDNIFRRKWVNQTSSVTQLTWGVRVRTKNALTTGSRWPINELMATMHTYRSVRPSHGVVTPHEATVSEVSLAGWAWPARDQSWHNREHSSVRSGSYWSTRAGQSGIIRLTKATEAKQHEEIVWVCWCVFEGTWGCNGQEEILYKTMFIFTVRKITKIEK